MTLPTSGRSDDDVLPATHRRSSQDEDEVRGEAVDLEVMRHG